MADSRTAAIEGLFYTGESSESIQAVLYFDASSGRVTLSEVMTGIAEGPAALEQQPEQKTLFSSLLIDIKIPPRLANTRRRLALSNGAAFVTQDNESIDALAERARALTRSSVGGVKSGYRGNWLYRLESHLGAVAACFVAIIAIAALTLVYGIPIAAKRIAYAVPQPVQNSMSEGTLELLDSLYLSPSELSREEQARVLALASDAIEGVGITSYAVELRTGIGPNAMALPDGTIVITDDIVELCANDNELLAILYHEIGHLQNRHLLRRVLQSSFVSLGLILMSGNVETIDSLIALPTFYLDLSYTRGFEIEADRYALQSLKDRGLGVDNFSAIMNKLEDSLSRIYVDEDADEATSRTARRQQKLLKYFASHPLTAERLALVEEYRD
ncbi:MAG: M48 family metallopeptidase [Proteobacteria bacterium]|nr:M48 family metallopeptidase [Pseudomonadota bacterium]MDA0896716.1 M48 family metallopeptidase [Pseudomonadota bacterium]MDA1244777.1 M48 family metallopeptidase [Pseudomonadota bacterium]